MLLLGRVCILGVGHMRLEADAAKNMRENRTVGGEARQNGDTTRPGVGFVDGSFAGIPSARIAGVPRLKCITEKRSLGIRSCA